MYQICEMYDLSHTLAAQQLQDVTYPWQILDNLSEIILQLGATLDGDYYYKDGGIWIHKWAKIAPTAYIGGPCIIGPETEVRHGAYIRGSALVGANCVVGNSVELKNVILFDNVQVPHYNYVGDSILGYKAHMGAGSITSNVKSDKTNVVIKGETPLETGRRKLGAMVGDFAEIGCNAVLNPGTVIGRRATVYPLSCVRGIVPENGILKNTGEIVQKKQL